MEEETRRALAQLQGELAAVRSGSTLRPTHEGFHMGPLRLYVKLVGSAFHVFQQEEDGTETDLTDAISLQGIPVSETDPAASEVLAYNATTGKWQPTAAGAPGAHKTTHQDGGTDEITVAGLSGVLADNQPSDHATPIAAHAAVAAAHHTRYTDAEADARVAAGIATHVVPGDPHTEYQKESDNAILDADIAPAEGFLRKTGAGAYTAHKSNLAAAVAPTVNDDSGDGYSVGSIWIDTTADKGYVCLDATPTLAVWTEITGGGAGGANVALSNLAAVAINTSLLSDADVTDDLGSAAKQWLSAYVQKIYLNSTATLDGATAGRMKFTGIFQATVANGNLVADDGGTIRIIVRATQPQIQLSGDALVTQQFQAGGAYDATAYHNFTHAGVPTQANFIQIYPTSSWQPASNSILLRVGNVWTPASGFTVDGLGFLAFANNNSYMTTFTAVSAASGVGATSGVDDLIGFSYAPASVLSANRNVQREVGFRMKSFTTLGGTPALASIIAFEIADSAVITGMAGVRMGFRIADLPQSTPAAGNYRTFGIQMQKQDASANGTVWPIFYGDFVQANPTAAWYYTTAGGWVSNTAEAATARGTAFTVLHDTVASTGDYYYVGYSSAFEAIFWGLSNIADNTARTVSYEYWNGAWTALTVSDNTILANSAFRQDGRVSFTPPADWVSADPGSGVAGFYVRCSTSVHFTTIPACYFIVLDVTTATPSFGMDAAGTNHLNSGIRQAVKTVTTTYTALVTDGVILANSAGGIFTITLPAATNTGCTLTIKRINASNTVTIDRAGSDTIDGATSLALDAQYESVTLVADGVSAWYITAYRGLA